MPGGPQNGVSNLAKAKLKELDANFKEEINANKNVTVQFNPETLKVTFANQIQNSGQGDQRGPQAQLFVGQGTTKLTVQLWFDVTVLDPASETDVRKLTAKVAYFITPQTKGSHLVPPAVRFVWGTFQFDGIVESLEETLEFFSSDGVPLRASVSLGLSQQKIQFQFNNDAAASPPPGAGQSSPAGTRPMSAAPQGSTVQSMASSSGQPGNWQAIASANGIENPRQLAPGQLLDLSLTANPNSNGRS